VIKSAASAENDVKMHRMNTANNFLQLKICVGIRMGWTFDKGLNAKRSSLAV
jgi:hypothetical protein